MPKAKQPLVPSISFPFAPFAKQPPLPAISVPKPKGQLLPSIALPSETAPTGTPGILTEDDRIEKAIISGVAAGLLPAGALAGLRGFLESGKRSRD